MKIRRMHRRLVWTAAFAVVFGACAVMATALPADNKSESSNKSKDRLFSEEFALESGGRLSVDVDDMDIRIETDSNGPGSVEIVVSRGNHDKAREWFEKSHFEAHLDGNHLVIENRDPRSNNFGWGNWNHNYSILAVITIPRETGLDVTTEDGDVQIDDVNGDARVYTEDGDLEFADIRGETIDISTEDGDVRAGSLGGDDITISTEDGDLDIDTIEGKRVRVSSSDGDITISRIDGDATSVETDDGDIEITVSGRQLDARCSDGDLTITLLSAMEVDIDADDGDIELNIPKGTGADIDLKGGDVSVRDIAIKGRVSDESIEGSINNGGALIRVRASDGSIRIRES